jgi:nucleotide-binding universal stress UspA family protein
MIKRILIAFDGSGHSQKAFDQALDLAGRYAAELYVLTVAPIPEVPSDVETEALIESARNHHSALLDALKEKTERAGVTAHFEVSVGHVARQIIDHAAIHQVDLIVLGHRGRGMLDRWLLGSVSSRVISYADCAVLVVR